MIFVLNLEQFYDIAYLKLHKLVNCITLLPLWNQNQFRNQRIKTQTKKLMILIQYNRWCYSTKITTNKNVWCRLQLLSLLCLWVLPGWWSVFYHMLHFTGVKPLYTWWYSLTLSLHECIYDLCMHLYYFFLINLGLLK